MVGFENHAGRTWLGSGVVPLGRVIAGAGNNGEDRTEGCRAERIVGTYTTREVIPLLEVTPLLGRTFTEEEDAPRGLNVAIISEGMWRSRFGASPNVIGRKLLVFGRSTEIVGVMPARFRFPNRETQIWMPRQLDPTAEFLGGFSYGGVARLKPGVTVQAAQREMANVLPRMAELTPMLAPGITTQMMLDQAKPAPRLGGAPRSGKSPAARRLAERLGYDTVCIDDLVAVVRAVTTVASHPKIHAMTGIDHRE